MENRISLFTYGTLRPNEPLWPWVQEHVIDFYPAKASGRLSCHPIGPYPVANFDQEGVIEGYLLVLQNNRAIADMIKMEIAAGYIYRRVRITNARTRRIEWAWAFHWSRRAGPKIESGDWSDVSPFRPTSGRAALTWEEAHADEGDGGQERTTADAWVAFAATRETGHRRRNQNRRI